MRLQREHRASMERPYWVMLNCGLGGMGTLRRGFRCKGVDKEETRGQVGTCHSRGGTEWIVGYEPQRC